DSAAVHGVAPGEEQKLIRVIEVCVLSRRTLAELHREGLSPLEGWRAMKIGLLPPRETLYERIHARVDAMLARRWLEEVRRLAEKLPDDAQPLDFVGYGG